MKLAIKVKNKKTKHSFVYKAESFPLTIGRAARNHLIIDDPMISADHARIEFQDGKLLFLNTGSKNTFSNGGSEAIEVEVQNGLTLALGHIELELLDIENEALEKTRDIEAPTGIKDELRRLAANAKEYIPYLAGFALMGAIDYYLNIGFREDWFKWKDLISGLFVFIVFTGVNAGVIAIYAKIHTGRYMLLPIIKYSLMFMLVFGFVSQADPFIEYFLYRDWLVSLFELIAGFGFVIMAAYIGTKTVFQSSRPQKVYGWFIVLSLVLFGSAKAREMLYQDYGSGFEANGRLGIPSSGYWPGVISLEEFSKEAEEYNDAIEELRLKKLEKRKDSEG